MEELLRAGCGGEKEGCGASAPHPHISLPATPRVHPETLQTLSLEGFGWWFRYMVTSD